jgi:hypothetical protein
MAVFPLTHTHACDQEDEYFDFVCSLFGSVGKTLLQKGTCGWRDNGFPVTKGCQQFPF